jgi:hypothetical protein
MIKKYFFLFSIMTFFITPIINYSFSKFTQNSKKIRNDFSLKENILFWGLLAGPTINLYWGRSWNQILANIKKEGKDLWKIIDIIKNTFSGDNKRLNFLKLFNNTFIRGALVWFVMPRLFHGIERMHKFTANNIINQVRSKNIFLMKHRRLKKQKEFDALIIQNNSELSSILQQLKEKNPKIEYRFNNTINNTINNLTSKKEIYKNAIKIKKALESKKEIVNSEQFEDYINQLDVDDAFKDIAFIKKNYTFFQNLPEIKLIKTPKSLFDEPLEDTLTPIKSTLLDREHIERDFDLSEENKFKKYDYFLNNKIQPQYTYPYSKYVNSNHKDGSWEFFDTVNDVTQLD